MSDLTPENKAAIDAKDVHELLSGVRFSAIGDPWFQGATGEYWIARMNKLRDEDPAAYTAASKDIGFRT